MDSGISLDNMMNRVVSITVDDTILEFYRRTTIVMKDEIITFGE